MKQNKIGGPSGGSGVGRGWFAHPAAAETMPGSLCIDKKGAFVRGCPNLAEIIRAVSNYLRLNPYDEKVRASISGLISKLDDGKSYGPSTESYYSRGALVRRFEQFFHESEVIVPSVAKAFAECDYKKLGELVDRSHKMTIQKLRNTIPETAWLPTAARSMGAVAASAFGAGFGGSCWALIQGSEKEASAFLASWQSAYNTKFPKWKQTSSFFVMRPGPGAFSL